MFILKKTFKRKIEEIAGLKGSYEEIKTDYEEKLQKYKIDNERLIKESERVRMSEERLIELEKALQVKIEVAKQGADPQQLFVLALDKALTFVWDLSKEKVQRVIEKLREEDSEEERKRFDDALMKFKKSYEYTEGIASPKTILKIKRNLEEQHLLAERQKNEKVAEEIKRKLDFLKEMEIVK